MTVFPVWREEKEQNAKKSKLCDFLQNEVCSKGRRDGLGQCSWQKKRLPDIEKRQKVFSDTKTHLWRCDCQRRHLKQSHLDLLQKVVNIKLQNKEQCLSFKFLFSVSWSLVYLVSLWIIECQLQQSICIFHHSGQRLTEKAVPSQSWRTVGKKIETDILYPDIFSSFYVFKFVIVQSQHYSSSARSVTLKAQCYMIMIWHFFLNMQDTDEKGFFFSHSLPLKRKNETYVLCNQASVLLVHCWSDLPTLS